LRDTAALTKNDLRLTMPRFLGDNFASNFSLVQKLIAFADQKDCTGAQLSLAWLLAQGDGIAPIPGTKKVNYLEENIAAINLNLGQADIEHLDTIFAPGKIAGDRYAPAMMAIVRQS